MSVTVFVKLFSEFSTEEVDPELRCRWLLFLSQLNKPIRFSLVVILLSEELATEVVDEKTQLNESLVLSLVVDRFSKESVTEVVSKEAQLSELLEFSLVVDMFSKELVTEVACKEILLKQLLQPSFSPLEFTHKATSKKSASALLSFEVVLVEQGYCDVCGRVVFEVVLSSCVDKDELF